MKSLAIYQGESNEPSMPAEFREFYKLWKLESLEVKETPVVDDKWEPITAISNFPVLRELSLISVGPITDFHLGCLHRLKSLEALSLNSTGVTSDGISKLAASRRTSNEFACRSPC